MGRLPHPIVQLSGVPPKVEALKVVARHSREPLTQGRSQQQQIERGEALLPVNEQSLSRVSRVLVGVNKPNAVAVHLSALVFPKCLEHLGIKAGHRRCAGIGDPLVGCLAQVLEKDSQLLGAPHVVALDFGHQQLLHIAAGKQLVQGIASRRHEQRIE